MQVDPGEPKLPGAAPVSIPATPLRRRAPAYQGSQGYFRKSGFSLFRKACFAAWASSVM